MSSWGLLWIYLAQLLESPKTIRFAAASVLLVLTFLIGYILFRLILISFLRKLIGLRVSNTSTLKSCAFLALLGVQVSASLLYYRCVYKSQGIYLRESL